MEDSLPQDGLGAGKRLAGARILIVEDQPEVAWLLEAAVTEAGGEVIAIPDSIERAMALIGSESISVAIITMIVGGVYADEIARELLRRDIPYVVTTGIGADRSHPELHAALTITKPFQASYVQAVLADLIARRQARARRS
jgi:DNA-binding NtrC family response regulator